MPGEAMPGLTPGSVASSLNTVGTASGVRAPVAERLSPKVA